MTDYRTTQPVGFRLTVGIATIVCACLLFPRASAQTAVQANGPPSVEAKNELARLTDKTRLINDVSATVMLTIDKAMTNQTYRYCSSRKLGLARMEPVLTSGRSMIYFVNKQIPQVCVQIGEDVFLLDQGGTRNMSALQDVFAGVINADIEAWGDIYCAGTDVVHDQTCELFLCLLPGGGILTKLWIGMEDGVVYRTQTGDTTCEFQNVKVNTGIDPRFLGASIASNGLPVVAQKDLVGLFRRSTKTNAEHNDPVPK
jgi:hypothetical protein